MNDKTFQRLNDPANLILVVLASLGLFFNWTYARGHPGIDFYVAWAAADSTRHEMGIEIYTSAGRKALEEHYRGSTQSEGTRSPRVAFASIPLLQPTAAPFLYAVVDLVSTRSYGTSLAIWHTLQVLGFCFGVLVFCRLLGVSNTASLALLVAGQFWMDAYQSDLRVANVNSIQLGLLAVSFWLLGKGSKSGYLVAASALLGMLVLFKVNLAVAGFLVLGAWLIRGDARCFLAGLSGLAIGAALAIALSSLFFGELAVWADWWTELMYLSGHAKTAQEGNFDLLKMLGLDPGFGSRALLAVVLSALTFGALWWGGRGAARRAGAAIAASRGPDLLEYAQMIGMGCVIYLLVSPQAWVHYYVLTLPMLIAAFRPWTQEPAHAGLTVILFRFMPLVVLLAFLNGPHWYLFSGEYHLVRGGGNVVALLILYVLGLWQLWFRNDR